MLHSSSVIAPKGECEHLVNKFMTEKTNAERWGWSFEWVPFLKKALEKQSLVEYNSTCGPVTCLVPRSPLTFWEGLIEPIVRASQWAQQPQLPISLTFIASSSWWLRKMKVLRQRHWAVYPAGGVCRLCMTNVTQCSQLHMLHIRITPPRFYGNLPKLYFLLMNHGENLNGHRLRVQLELLDRLTPLPVPMAAWTLNTPQVLKKILFKLLQLHVSEWNKVITTNVWQECQRRIKLSSCTQANLLALDCGT